MTVVNVTLMLEPYLKLDTPDYAGVITEQFIMEKLLPQAGIWLATIIN
jgi:hypothetical protein